MKNNFFLYCRKPVSIQYDQPFLELPIDDPLQKNKKKEEEQGGSLEIYKKKKIPLVPDSTDQFDITDKFDISKKNIFEM